VTPEQLAKPGTEHAEQVALFAWAAFHVKQHPALAHMFAIPNGGSRGDTQRSARIVGSRMKAEGVRPGVSDIFLPEPVGIYHGLFIEMKRKDGGEESKEQKTFGASMRRKGYGYACCHGWEAARDVITAYLTHANTGITNE